MLSYVSKQTKALLSRIGVFTVTSFHALVCARTPLNTTCAYATSNGGAKRKNSSLLSTFKSDSVTSRIRSKSPVNANHTLQQNQRWECNTVCVSK